MSLYREEILDHYQNPRNYGKPDKAEVTIREANVSCGDQIDIYLKLKGLNNKTRIVEDIKFEGEGCAISLAAASMLTEAVKGRKITEIEKLVDEDVYSLLGGKVNPGRVKCATLALVALKKALIKYSKGGK